MLDDVPAGEVLLVGAQRGFILRTAVDVVEQDAGQAPERQAAQP
jgi:hypothetical protein